MSAELHILDAAWEAASWEDLDRPAAMVKAAAPHIVAAELRRLAEELIAEENPHVIWRAIARRADELDGAS